MMKPGDSELALVWSDDLELTGDLDIYFMRVTPSDPTPALGAAGLLTLCIAIAIAG